MFCLSRNKISRLPTYLPQFHKLEVLRVDRNPVEWPPKAIMELPGSNDLSLMKEWIQNVQNWIETESSRGQSEDVLYHDGDSFDRNMLVFMTLDHVPLLTLFKVTNRGVFRRNTTDIPTSSDTTDGPTQWIQIHHSPRFPSLFMRFPHQKCLL